MSQRYLGGIITANPTLPTLSSASGVWTLEQDFQNSASITPQVIGRSVRLRSSASAYFNRTFGTPTNQKVGTFSFWIKRGSLGARRTLVSNDTGSVYGYWEFDASDRLNFGDFFAGNWTSTSVYRDPSAWYHIVIALDSTAAVNADRIKVYVNNRQDTTGSATITQNSNWYLLQNSAAQLGAFTRISTYFDGYLTEVNFIDGQALTPSSFGAFDSNGVWQPLSYRGTYGTNGFYLNFSDNSAATAAAIGKDYSGNGNNWTPNNISVTAGVTYDSMIDSPTNSASASNYCVLNPLYKGYGGYTATPVTISNANLTITGNPSANNIAATMALPTSGQFYYEYVWTATSGGEMDGGIIGETGTAYFYRYDGTYWNGSSYVAYGASYTTNDVIGVAVDTTNLTFTFYKNGTSQGTKTAAFPSGVTYFPWFYTSNTVAASVNFGQRPFAYTPPTGFLALNTQNLPAVTINNGAQYMAATTYTGNSSTLVVTNGGNNPIGTTFQPDLVWGKARAAAVDNGLYDSVRGVSKRISSNLTGAEITDSGVTSFNSNGFTLGSSTSMNDPNPYVAWQWKESATSGFDIVPYTFGSTGTATISHNLGAVPKMILAKRLNATEQWLVYQSSVTTQSQYLGLNTTSSVASSANLWGSSAFTSSEFYFTATSGYQYIFYCFAPVAGYSAMGSYTGNGSTDGPFVYCGFRPKYVLVKMSSSTGDWYVFDTSRDTYNATTQGLLPNSAGTETTYTGWGDILSNGFKIRRTDAAWNTSGGTYLYLAFAENPFNISRAR